MRSSTSPVARSLFTVSAVRATTLPVRVSTHSERAVSTSGEGRRIRLDHALGDAVMVAQVDEDQPAMVAAAIDPARQAHGLADIGFAELAAGMGAIGVHGQTLEERRVFGGLWGAGQGQAGLAEMPGFSCHKARLAWPAPRGIAMKSAACRRLVPGLCSPRLPWPRRPRRPTTSSSSWPTACAMAASSRATCPTWLRLKTEGVDFTNSHSLFPTITTVNASAIATGHYIGDTGDFGNTLYAGTPMISLQGLAPRGFLENDTVLAEMNQKFGGNYLNEDNPDRRAPAPRAWQTAVIGKVGPARIQDSTAAADGSETLILDDNTGHEGGFGLPAWFSARDEAGFCRRRRAAKPPCPTSSRKSG